MRNVKLRSFWSRSIHLAVAALFIVSLAPRAWSDETAPAAPEAAPPATTEMPNEAPAAPADPGAMGAGSPEEAPPAERPVHKKARKAKHAKKKAKHAKKKSHVKSKKKKKKKKHSEY